MKVSAMNLCFLLIVLFFLQSTTLFANNSLNSQEALQWGEQKNREAIHAALMISPGNIPGASRTGPQATPLSVEELHAAGEAQTKQDPTAQWLKAQHPPARGEITQEISPMKTLFTFFIFLIFNFTSVAFAQDQAKEKSIDSSIHPKTHQRCTSPTHCVIIEESHSDERFPSPIPERSNKTP